MDKVEMYLEGWGGDGGGSVRRTGGWSMSGTV